jgi:hypothetical protein
MGSMQLRIRRRLQRAAAIALAALVATPELAAAVEPPARSKSLDAMSPAELDAYVRSINETANWRKYRRPNDPPDFVPGKPVRVMHGAGAMLGRGGHGGRSFRASGLAGRRGGAIGSSRRRGSGREDQSAMDRGRGSSRSSGSSLGSGSSRSSFGSGSRSSFGSGSGNSMNGNFQ